MSAMRLTNSVRAGKKFSTQDPLLAEATSESRGEGPASLWANPLVLHWFHDVPNSKGMLGPALERSLHVRR